MAPGTQGVLAADPTEVLLLLRTYVLLSRFRCVRPVSDQMGLLALAAWSSLSVSHWCFIYCSEKRQRGKHKQKHCQWEASLCQALKQLAWASDREPYQKQKPCEAGGVAWDFLYLLHLEALREHPSLVRKYRNEDISLHLTSLLITHVVSISPSSVLAIIYLTCQKLGVIVTSSLQTYSYPKMHLESNQFPPSVALCYPKTQSYLAPVTLVIHWFQFYFPLWSILYM